MTEHLQDEAPTENPLAGDVDNFVHPDETRTDEQVTHDERVLRDLHMSGDDGADEYWADYDEYHGTVNGGESPATETPKDRDVAEEPAESHLSITPHPGYRDGGQIYVTTSKRTYQQHPANIQKMHDEGLTDEQIAAKLDSEHDEIWKRIRARHAEMYRQMDEEDYDPTDPLAGDVDPTGGYHEE